MTILMITTMINEEPEIPGSVIYTYRVFAVCVFFVRKKIIIHPLKNKKIQHIGCSNNV